MRLTSNDRFAVAAQWSPTWAAAITIGTLLLVLTVDYASGSAPVQYLYYLPIIFASRSFGIRGGVLAGLLAVVLYHSVNPHPLTLRNGETHFVEIMLFLAVGVITAKLTKDAADLRRLAMTDDLTGLHNLRSFEAQLATLVCASRNRRTPLALLVLDVDRLKSLNDQYGHLAGAEAVRAVGRIIGERLPQTAVGCRYGGDEFVIAIPQCGSFQGRRVADDLCQAVHDCAPVLAGRPFAVGTLSISVGVVSTSFSADVDSKEISRRDVEDGEALFRRTDAALYRAKAKGRNQVCVA
jgi:diguanylate cyclase (GGDEF)-like protein